MEQLIENIKQLKNEILNAIFGKMMQPFYSKKKIN